MHLLHDKSLASNPVVLDVRVVSGSGGGPDKTILNSPRFLGGEGYRMLCGYMHPPGDRGFDCLRAKAEHWQAPLIAIPDRGAWDWQVIPRLLHICRTERVRIWHGHDYKSNLLGLVLRRFWPMQLVTTVHGWVTATTRMSVYFAVDRLCLPHYQRVLCVSDDLRQRCAEAGVPVGRCVLLENAIDLDQYTQSRSNADAKAALGLAGGRLVIGAVGRLAPEKGFDLLIRAVARLVQQGHELSLIIIGEGERRAALAELVRSLALSDRFRLLGYQSDPIPSLEAMDIFALSSLREGLPNVLLEAMAMRLPVAATRVGGVPALIEHDNNGLLLDAASIDALAGAIVRLASDAPLRARLGQAGRRTVEQRYSFAARMRKLGQIYDQLLAESVHDYRRVI